MTEKVQQMVRAVRDAVTAPDVDQKVGDWRDDGRCCVGARLAHALGLRSGSYLKGADE